MKRKLKNSTQSSRILLKKGELVTYLHQLFYSSISGPVATALLLVFKSQRLHRSPNLLPHPQVIVQLCATAGDSLNTCQQSMGNEDELNLVRNAHDSSV